MNYSGRSILAVLLLSGIVLLYGQGKRTPSAPRNRNQESLNAIQKLEDDMRLAALKNDAAWWVENLADGFTGTDFLGHVRDRSQTIELQRSSALVYDAMNLSDRNVHIFNDTVIVTGKMTTEGTYRGQDLSGDFQFTRVWVRIGEDWKLVASQSTKIVP
ncbi:MAG TPA: nuclear transport factor 2 family protein [Blastocatellia bacterium]|nr:nuclear transport factor 2 family protein [Blastocatellia bacterium]